MASLQLAHNLPYPNGNKVNLPHAHRRQRDEHTPVATAARYKQPTACPDLAGTGPAYRTRVARRLRLNTRTVTGGSREASRSLTAGTQPYARSDTGPAAAHGPVQRAANSASTRSRSRRRRPSSVPLLDCGAQPCSERALKDRGSLLMQLVLTRDLL